MAIIKNATNNKCFGGCGEKGTLLLLWKCKLIKPLWEQYGGSFKKLKIELSYDPAIPLQGKCPEKTIIQKDTCTPVFTEAPFTIARAQKQLKCPPIEEWKKMWYITTKDPREYCSVTKGTKLCHLQRCGWT